MRMPHFFRGGHRAALQGAMGIGNTKGDACWDACIFLPAEGIFMVYVSPHAYESLKPQDPE
jgi:hypothetical protein